MLFIIKFFPEITIKSKVVRKQMARRLKDNVYTLLRAVDAQVKVVTQWDKMTVETSQDSPELNAQVKTILARTPGIANFLEVQSWPVDGLDAIAAKCLEVCRERLENRSFVVRCKRTGQHAYTSHEIERHVGGYLFHHIDSARVDLHHPDTTLLIEVHGDTLFIVIEKVEGLGGYPLGEVEPVLSLISGGFDSPVASYLLTKRGAPTHYCFFNLGGREHELGVKEVAYHLWQRYGASQKVKFVSVPFEGVVAEILEKVDNSQMGVILKRMMLRAASQIAEKLEIKALVTGEALSQVSSQTLSNLAVIDEVCDMLVLRPLVAMDKGDIVLKAREIGTEVFAANMPEYCGVISVKPTTRARLYRVQAQEEKFDMAVLDRAVENACYSVIDNLGLEEIDKQDVEVLSVPLANSIVVDIRHPDEQERRPLRISGQEITLLPFYRLHKAIQTLDKSQRYLLYCEKGVMSRLHASHLLAEGFQAAVYRPPAFSDVSKPEN